MRKRLQSRDRGAAAIEFALIATLLLTILVGVFEGGRVWLIQSTLSQAAREGAREMAVTNEPGSAETVMSERLDAANLAGVSVSVTPSDCTIGSVAVATATLEVSSLTGLLDPLFGDDGTLPLTGTAVMRCGG